MEKKKFIFIGAVSVLTVIAVALGIALKIVGLLLFSTVISYLILPLIKLLEKRITETPAVLLSFAIIGTAITAIIVLITPIFTEQLATLAGVLPGFIEGTRQSIIAYAEGVPLLKKLSESFLSENDIADMLFKHIYSFSPSALISAISSLFLSPVIVYYMIKEREALRGMCLFMLPGKMRTPSIYMFRSINRQMRDYISGQLIIIVIVSTLTSLALMLFGYDYWLILGVLMGAFNTIPYIGPVLGSIPIVLVALPLGQKKVLEAIIIIIAVQQIDNFFIHPLIISSTVKMHPVTVLICVAVGNKIGSFLGMLLAIPTFIILRILLCELYKAFAERKCKFLKMSKI